jgi:DNA-binding NarL/FixJ family response regulator
MSEIGTPESSGNRRRILLADDHPLILERVTTLLQSTFDVVGVAHNGLQMVEEALRLNPDIIVADISMPELDGIEAAHRLREMGAKASVVFLTIHESPEFVEACLAEGALGFVAKSHMKTDLVPAVNAALAGRRFVSSARHT